jgi:hypothetical protein
MKVVVEWLKIPLRNRVVLGSNLGPQTGYPDSLPQSFQEIGGIVPKN